MATVLNVGLGERRERIPLAGDTDVDVLRADIETAARSGGGWVKVQGMERDVEIFVSAGIYLWITDRDIGHGGTQALD